jgi:hypothetical protein
LLLLALLFVTDVECVVFIAIKDVELESDMFDFVMIAPDALVPFIF